MLRMDENMALSSPTGSTVCPFFYNHIKLWFLFGKLLLFWNQQRSRVCWGPKNQCSFFLFLLSLHCFIPALFVKPHMVSNPSHIRMQILNTNLNIIRRESTNQNHQWWALFSTVSAALVYVKCCLHLRVVLAGVGQFCPHSSGSVSSDQRVFVL